MPVLQKKPKTLKARYLEGEYTIWVKQIRSHITYFFTHQGRKCQNYAKFQEEQRWDGTEYLLGIDDNRKLRIVSKIRLAIDVKSIYPRYKNRYAAFSYHLPATGQNFKIYSNTNIFGIIYKRGSDPNENRKCLLKGI